MKTVILFGSPRKDGNTRQLTDRFAQGLKASQGDVRVLYLNDMNIRPCQGCQACAENGVCRINDDMKDIIKYVQECDLVVYATPIYWYGPSAQLKLAMDRCVAFYDKDYNSRIKGKKAVTLVSCADTNESTCEPAIGMFTKTFEGLGMEYTGHVEAIGCSGKGSVSKQALDDAASLGRSVTG